MVDSNDTPDNDVQPGDRPGVSGRPDAPRSPDSQVGGADPSRTPDPRNGGFTRPPFSSSPSGGSTAEGAPQRPGPSAPNPGSNPTSKPSPGLPRPDTPGISKPSAPGGAASPGTPAGGKPSRKEDQKTGSGDDSKGGARTSKKSRWGSNGSSSSAASNARGRVHSAKADRQRERAAQVGRGASAAFGGNKDDQNLGEGLGRDLADVKNAEGLDKVKAARDAGEKAARLVLNKKTGGASEKILKTAAGKATLKVVKVAAAVNAVLPVILVFVLVAVTVAIVTAVVGGSARDEGVGYALEDGSPMALTDEYLDIYKEAGREHEVPWTLLAGIAQVATEHGRFAASDVLDYGLLVDRAPNRAPIGSTGQNFGSSGKFAPPPGTSIAVIGDSFVASGAIPPALVKELDGYSLSTSGENGAGIDDVAPDARAAIATGIPVVVVQVGVNDVNQEESVDKYRDEVASLMDAASTSTCFVWVGLQEFYGGDYGYLGPRARRFNQILQEESAARPWVTVADVATPLAVAGMQSDDGLHLSPLGSRTWAAAVARTVRGCVRGRELSRPATLPDPAAAPDAGTESDVAGSFGARTTALGQPVKVSPEYGTYVCTAGVCGPNPPIGVHKGAARGVFLLTPEFLKTSSAGRSPDDLQDAANMLAEELARIRDAVLDGDLYDQYDGWETDPVAARLFWGQVVSQAPVALPIQASVSSECDPGPVAGPQGSPYVWPVADPVAIGEFGAALDGDERVQVAGMLLGSSSDSESNAALASGPGKVVEVGSDVDGSFVVLAHEGKFSTVYKRLKTLDSTVAVGTELVAGAQLGTFTSSLYFEARVASAPRNPRLYVADASSLPLAESVSRSVRGEPESDPLLGSPVDPCTNLRLTSSSASVSPTTSLGTVGLPGSLVMPAAGVRPDKLVDTFSDCRDGCTRKHQGIDIIIPVGTPLIAVTDATVHDDSAGGVPCPKTGLPGKGVTLKDAQGNHYYYGHMDQVRVSAGQKVAAGSIIGTSGATGNACVSAPHLHFSINENTPRVVNPYPVLSSARPLNIGDFASALGAGEASRLMGLNALNGGPEYVVAYATMYGGLVANDPDAGTFPGSAVGFQPDSQFGSSGDELARRAPQVAAVIRMYFPPEQWDNAIRVAECESGLDPSAVGENRSSTGAIRSRDRGLFQFNDGNMAKQGTLQSWLARTGEDPTNFDKAFDPHWSARAAAAKVRTDGGWGAWSCAHTPYGERTYGLSIVSLSPKEIATNGATIDYSWQQPGAGDTSRRSLSLAAPSRVDSQDTTSTPNPAIYAGPLSGSIVNVSTSGNGWSYDCTGTVVAGSRAVLTAAHCVVPTGTGKLLRNIKVSQTPAASGTTPSYKPSSVSVRLDWENPEVWCEELGRLIESSERLQDCTRTNADVAVLWFDKPLPFKGIEVPRCDASCPADADPTGDSLLLGFQLSGTNGVVLRSLPSVDKKAKTPTAVIPDPDYPAATLPLIKKLTSCKIPANFQKVYTNFTLGVRCGMIQGASGGVLVQDADGSPKVSGVVSAVYGESLWNLMVPLDTVSDAVWRSSGFFQEHRLK